nr:YoaK family protein [uncultured Anaerostipes sp.]
MEGKRIQMSESLFLAALLAVVGGFLDAYSYLLRGGVFANAQTGNIVLLGVYLQRGNFNMVIHYLVPIAAFAVGVVLVEITKKVFKNKGKIHWRQRIVVLEAVLLGVVGVIPMGNLDVIANVLISFVCAVQVQTFRKVHGNAFASTMCTGNLRSGTEALYQYDQTKDRAFLAKGIKYYSVIGFFVIGAVIGGVMTGLIEEKSVFLCSILLLISCGIMVKEFRS